MKKTALLLLIGGVIMTLLLSGCNNSEKEINGSEVREVSVFSNLCNNGTLYNESDDRVMFCDFVSMQSACLCSKSNCSHRDPDSCSAYGMGHTPFIYEDRLYFFKSEIVFDKDNKAHEKTDIYTADLDGGNRRVLLTADDIDFGYSWKMYITNGDIYFTGYRREYDEYGNQGENTALCFCKYNFAENKFTVIKDFFDFFEEEGEIYSSGISIYGIFNNCAYIGYSYSKTPYDMETGLKSMEFESFFIRYELDSGEFKEYGLDEKTEFNSGWAISKDEKKYTFLNEKGETLDVENMGQFYYIVNDVAFFDEGCVELRGGKKHSVLIPFNEGEVRTEFVDYINGKYIAEVFDFDRQERTYKAYDFEEIVGELSVSDEKHNEENNIVSENFPLYETNFPSFEEVKESYPDKTVLLWTIEETGYERNYPFRTREINRYLDEKGYDFAVCFYPLNGFYTKDDDKSYTEYVKELAEQGKADIIYTSLNGIGEGGTSTYNKYIFDGLLEPLDGYFETELGQELYPLMPEKHWEGLKVNGSIYGVNGSLTTLNNDYGYYVNAELAEKYGFDITKPVEEQLDILRQVKEEEGINCDVFAMGSGVAGQPVFFTGLKELAGGVYWDEDKQEARCVLDNEGYTEKLKFLHTLKKEGLLQTVTTPSAHTFFILLGSKFVGHLSTEPVEKDYFERFVKAFPVFENTSSIVSCPIATGISSTSENKDKAFELLALTQTDPYLNNLLTFGVEGEDYGISEGYADNIINRLSLDRFANYMVCNKFDDYGIENKFTPDEYREIFDNAKMSAEQDLVLCGEGLETELKALQDIMCGFEVPSAEADFDEAMKRLREELEQAGLQRVIDECNRQYEEIK